TPLKLYRGGVRQKDVMRHLARNSRAPGVVLADIAAMVRACREAGEALSLLLGRHGRPAVEAAIDEVIGYTSRRVAAHLARLPAGRFAAEAQVPVAHEPPLTVRLALTNGNAGVVFDFAGTSAAVAAPFNATPEATAAFAALPLLAPLLDELAINDGLLEPFTIEAPEGTLVHPRFPSATGLSAHTTGHAIAHAVSAAMRAAGATPDLCPRLDGPGAVAALYPPIGTVAEMTARDLAPGFPRAADGFGPPALWGSRQLVSAEALEGSDRLRIIARERRAGGGMAVRVRILERAREANWLVPSSGPGGILRRGAAGETQALLATGLALAPGDELEFTYSGGGEGPDGEA
ncbi:MAG: hydantoinase B/oxoprolinase family protein, partial [Alphaproteobacteria bacterium]|nr:hydantoinase B/oxoprolinase family protein [Alphaproteobacteria bacterium]